MKILRLLILILSLASSISAKRYLSTKPPLKSTIISLEPMECNEICLTNLKKSGMIFSFLALFDEDKVSNEFLINDYYKFLAKLNAVQDQQVIINVIMPINSIGNYANTITNSIISHLSSKYIEFKLNIIDIKNETDIDDINRAIQKVRDKKADYVIAILTDTGVRNLMQGDIDDIEIFIPTVSAKDIGIKSIHNVIFGGVSYKKQIEKIIDHIQENNISIFKDSSYVSDKLTGLFHNSLEALNEKKSLLDDSNISDVKYTSTIKENQVRFKKVVKNKKLINSFTLFNTPLLKTSILLSNISYYGVEISQAYSTQINYNPLLLQLTQLKDREKFYITNSIIDLSPLLIEYNNIMNNDIKYDWINYTTTVILDHILNKYYGIKNTINNVSIVDNEFEYGVEIIESKSNKFSVVKNKNIYDELENVLN